MVEMKDKKEKKTLVEKQHRYLKKLMAISWRRSFYSQKYFLIGGFHKFSKWWWYDEPRKEPIDYYSVLLNELIFEIDIKEWKLCKKFALKIIDVLEAMEVPYYACPSGGKGIHIHIYFDCKNFSEKLMEKASRLGFESKHIRYWLWHKILDEAKFDNKYRGKGKAFDDSVINWSDAGKGHLIRAIGGKKLLKDENGNLKTYAFKNTFADNKIPDRKDNMASADEVVFPDEISVWWLDLKEFNSFLEGFIAKKEKEFEETYNKLDIKLKGKYSELPCVKKIIMQGVDIGLRNQATFPLTLALFLDNHSEEKIKSVLREFKNKCPQIPEPFTEREAYSWIEWVKKVRPVWNCRRCKDLGVCEKGNCEFNNIKYYPIWEFLEQNDLLDKIIEIVRDVGEHKKQATVVGETNNLKIIFLVLRSAYSDDPQNLNLEEETRVGKTALIKPFFELFPKNDMIIAAGMTKKSIFYDYADSADGGPPIVNLNNKIIFLLEESGSQPFLNTIKPILSHDTKEMEYKFVEKLGHGQNITKTVRIVGWPVYIGLSAFSGKQPEHLGRTLTINATNKSEKFKKVIKNKALKNPFYRGEHNKDWLILKESIKSGWIPMGAINLFRGKIADIFPHNDPRSQDDYARFMSMLEQHASVNQRNRKIMKYNKTFAVVLKKEDIVKTFDLMQKALESTILGISGKVRQFYDEILFPNRPEDEEDINQLTYARILNLFNEKYRRSMREQTLKTSYLQPLIDLGYVEIGTSGKRNVVKVRNVDFSQKVEEFKRQLHSLEFSEIGLKAWLEKMNLDIKQMEWGEIKNSGIVKLSPIKIEELCDYLTNSIYLQPKK